MNRKNILRCLSMAVSLVLLASSPVSVLSCDNSDKACLRRAVEGHAVRRIAFWRPYLKSIPEDRIDQAPAELIDYLILDNRLNGFPETPEPVDLSPAFLADLKAALAGLPMAVRDRVNPKLIGIFVVRNLGGTGYMEAVMDEHDHPVAGFIILDEAVLVRTANAWLTWRENTPFRPDREYRLEGAIELPADDNRKNAIQFILLHEIGHLLSVGERFHPFWFAGPSAVKKKGDYPFLDLSWIVAPGGAAFLSRYESVFPFRKDVVFYGTPRLDGRALPEVYRKLAETNFASLYGASNPYDDFAEAFAIFVHTVMMKKPYEIRILKGGELQAVFRSCWTEDRCEAKRRILSEWLLRK
ncbi:MAG: hypothetical protein AB2L22_02250 [Syntrophales bacterium]